MDTQSKLKLRIGVTGHQKLTRQQSVALKPLIKRAIENIIYYHGNTFGSISTCIFTTSLAEGADILFANVAIENFDCKLKIILPFEKEEYIKDFSTEEAALQFEFLLHDQKVSEVLCLNKYGSGERSKLYFEAGKKLVDENDYIIAVWNEEKNKGAGVTGDIAAYAIASDKNILVINPFSESLEIKGIYLPEFAKPPYDKFMQTNSKDNPVENFFVAYDNQAVINQSSFKNIWNNCFNAGLIAAFLFSTAISFFQASPLIQLFLNVAVLSCIVIITRLISNERKRSFHENYLNNRHIAERLRIDNIFFKCGFQPYKIQGKAVYTPFADIETLTPLVIINKFIQLCSYSNASISGKQDIAGSLIKGQIDYHRQRIERLLKYRQVNSLITNGLISVFVLLLLFYILDKIYELSGAYTFSGNPHVILPGLFFSSALFLSLFVPALIARFEAKKYLGAWEKLISQSEYMLSYFEEISVKIKSTEDDRQLHQVLNALNENMYVENIDWEMLMLTKNEMMIYRKRKTEHTRQIEVMNEKFGQELLNAEVEIQQQTMQHIGREIHDNVGQKLALAALYMQQIDAENKNSVMQKKIISTTSIINESLTDLRNLSKNLTETGDLHTDLFKLINAECKRINVIGYCSVEFQSNAEHIEVSQAIKNFVLRILQEFLQNSLRHADCSQIKIHLQNEEAGLTIESFDNGKGFALNNNYTGIGLKNMKKRAEMIGADLIINSELGEGTKMHLFIPAGNLSI